MFNHPLLFVFFLLLSPLFPPGAFGQTPATSEGVAAALSEARPTDPTEPAHVVAERTLQQEAVAWMRGLLRAKVGDNTGRQILLSFAILLFTLLVRKAVLEFLLARLKSLTARTSSRYDDGLLTALEGPAGSLLLVVGLFFSVTTLSLDGTVDLVVFRLFQASTLVVVFWGILRLVDLLAEILQDLARDRGQSIYHFIPLIKRAARVFLILIGAILVVQNLGYSVGSLLAGLGIGGLAVALAAQESLSNFFGSVSIAADRPFKVGDWIQVGDRIDGDVEEVGLRSTKVRTWAKSQLSIPNKVLANEIIENWSRMPKRRVKQVIGVTYETKPDQMEELVEAIRGILREDKDVHQEFILVNFTDFGSSSLDILVYYFTVTTKWLAHMDIRQRINLKIMRAIEARGLSVAFPTRTIYFEGDVARRAMARDQPG
ncbi:MAG: mechanosensitive ion channel family protein [Opitutaceae bacterium]